MSFLGVWIQIFRECLEHVGIDSSAFADDEIAKHTHDWSAVVELGAQPQDIAAFGEHAKILANKRLPDAQQFPLAYETLQAIQSSGRNLAIFSTMDRVMFDPAMRHNNLNSLTNVAIAGTDVPNRKPQPDGILKALADLGVAQKDFGNAVYMGDKDTDIQAAHNAGIDAILFFPPIHQTIYDKTATLLHKPESVIASWQELLDSLTA